MRRLRRSRLMSTIAGAGAMASVPRSPASKCFQELTPTASTMVVGDAVASPQSTVIGGAHPDGCDLSRGLGAGSCDGPRITVDVASRSPRSIRSSMS